MTRITRVEVITNTGRDYVSWEDDNDITYMLQDSNRTLKVFVGKAPPEQLMTEEENERYFEEAKQIVEKHFAKKKMTETEKIRAEIKVLEKKLSLLEEIEKQPQTLFDVIRNLGYSVDCSWEIVDAVEAFQKSKENEQGTWNYDPDAKFRKQEPEEDEWKLAALRFGEKLSSIGPCGYYDFTAGEWVEWVLNAYEKTADDYLKLLEKERAKVKKLQEKEEVLENLRTSLQEMANGEFRRIDDVMDEVKKLQEKNWSYKITDEHGETTR